MFWYEIFFLIFIILHILCCILIFFGIHLKRIKVRRFMWVVAVFMPIFGPFVIMVLHFQLFFKSVDCSALGVEKFKIESELYKSVRHENNRTSGSAVSIEEALIVNTPKERRSIIMDILNDNPKLYIDFLKMAGSNEDTEVVHYAVTAMVQISKENDQMLWDFEKQFSERPDDLDILNPYCEFLWCCLEQGLMQGQVEKMNRNLFDTLIQKKIRLDEANITDYVRCIQNNLRLQHYTEAGIMLEKARTIWPHQEELLILKIQYAADLQRPEEVQALLEELDTKDVYLSAKAREVIAFWKD